MGFHAEAWCGGAAFRPHDGTSHDRRRERNTNIEKISTRANLSTKMAVLGVQHMLLRRQNPLEPTAREIP